MLIVNMPLHLSMTSILSSKELSMEMEKNREKLITNMHMSVGINNTSKKALPHKYKHAKYPDSFSNDK